MKIWIQNKLLHKKIQLVIKYVSKKVTQIERFDIKEDLNLFSHLNSAIQICTENIMWNI